MLKKAATLVLGLWLSGPLAAQDQISPELFLDQVVGNTLTFRGHSSNNFVGVEQFLRRDLSVWATANGRCTYGQIEVRGPLICFIYDDNPDPGNCWTPFVEDGDLVVVGVRGDIQRITSIERRDISCEAAPLS